MEWVEGSLSNVLTDIVTKALAAELHLEPNDLLILTYGNKLDAVSISLFT